MCGIPGFPQAGVLTIFRMRFHPWALVPTVLYVGFVGWMTLRPTIYGAGTASLLWSLLGRFEQHQATSWLTFDTVEGLANVALFIPLGFFLALLLPRRLFLVAALLCVVGSVGIEAFQGAFLPGRVADVRDVIHNSTGGLIGAVVAVLGRVLFIPRRRAGGRLRAA